MRIPVQNLDDWLPKPKQPESKQPSVGTGELRVAPSRTYKPALDQLRVVMETPVILSGPGMPLGVLDKQSRLADFRALSDVKLERGITFDGAGQPRIADVPHAASTADRPVNWDPFAYMPRFVFEVGEDALPVSPSFDGDADVNNDAPQEPNGPGGSYRDGVIGKNQALNGGFAVSQKGAYTVLTYSFYYATNKAGQYHGKDWSHAQVYLKPNAKGELSPEFLYTSWHHGGILTPWDDVKKDEQGKPVLEVQLGSHAVAPLGKSMPIPKKGLQIQGDGQALLDGKPIDYALTWDAFQSNVSNARILESGTDAFSARMLTMRYGKVAFDPIMPEVFLQEAGFAKAVLEKAEPLVDTIKGLAKDLASGAKRLWSAIVN
jgi:hypothetical protein